MMRKSGVFGWGVGGKCCLCKGLNFFGIIAGSRIVQAQLIRIWGGSFVVLLGEGVGYYMLGQLEQRVLSVSFCWAVRVGRRMMMNSVIDDSIRECICVMLSMAWVICALVEFWSSKRARRSALFCASSAQFERQLSSICGLFSVSRASCWSVRLSFCARR